MGALPLVVTIAVIAAAAIAIVLIGRRWERAQDRRQREIAALAKALGLEFSSEAPFDIANRFAWCRALSRNIDLRSVDSTTRPRCVRAYNVMRGRLDGRSVVFFDCHDRAAGSDQPVKERSVLVMHHDGAFPHLSIRPAMTGDKVVSATAPTDVAGINFESGEFSRVFCVESPDREFAYAVVNPRTMELLLANRGWTIELYGPDVAIFNDQCWSAQEIQEAREFLDTFLRLIPGFVSKDWGPQGRAGVNVPL